MKILQTKWNVLFKSKTNDEELKAVKELNAWISKKNISIKPYAITNKGLKMNLMQNKIEEISNFKDITIEFKWRDKQFIGKSWIPKNKKNIYIFFRE